MGKSTPDSVSPKEQRNGRAYVTAMGLQGIGDQLVNAKTVLPWVFSMAGVSSFFAALLIPIRESGSMLPQAAITPWLTAKRRRATVWSIGALIQAISAILMGLSIGFARGALLGVLVVVFLATFSLGRAIGSISAKDVQARTISKGRRGRLTGTSTMVSGLIAVTVGIAIRALGHSLSLGFLALLVAAGGVCWLLASLVFTRIDEPTDEGGQQGSSKGWAAEAWELLSTDRAFRRFVIVRSLLLASSLSPAFIVQLSSRSSNLLAGLGSFIVASGLASLIGGRVSGALADKSSRNTMSYGALATSIALLAIVAVSYVDAIAAWALPIGFFIVTLIHTGVRVGRKTYVVDMGEGDQTTKYVAVANTAMGFILLFFGAVSGVIALAGARAALVALALVGIAGFLTARSLPEVSKGHA
ncbi:hypothetical protein HMPREF1219_00581 [Corynebacterium pyruviciproducens ATCC BAA-1742]|uniref:Major facilitator superfamily (MFS) profile domain-containing protein n=1 Tax=Corynebacterium pyruviciproducens ATCC BAA-1742 TaxID=1125779 RepID=S2Z0H8_9CORY|nr:hypothetical protein [Corynebacterium pyruviciproducens]EPD70148.1 hypothetical protein HMPREF1219_00581 [Corynebacterium pyruviciproducens ATCC BAA-1742]